jgi:hypothetical protein
MVLYESGVFMALKIDVAVLRDVLPCIRFEIFTAVTTKNAVLWDVTLRCSRKNRLFGRM